MECDIENNFIIAKLSDEEDLFDDIVDIIGRYNISSGIIVSGIGMLKNFELGYFDGKEYLKEVYKEPCELVALHGSIALVKKKPAIHIHCGLARRDHDLIGGHLFGATVYMMIELTMLKLDDMKLFRRKNRKSGLMELEIDEG